MYHWQNICCIPTFEKKMHHYYKTENYLIFEYFFSKMYSVLVLVTFLALRPWESSRMWEENPIMWQLGLYFHINCLTDVKNVTIFHIPGQTSLIMNIFITFHSRHNYEKNRRIFTIFFSVCSLRSLKIVMTYFNGFLLFV